MGEIKVGRMVLGMCQTNCYFLYREGEKQTIVVDPADKGANIYNALEKNGFQVAGILLTHGHFDHIWGLEELKTAANLAAQTAGREPVKVYAGEAERLLLNSPELNVSERAGRACGVTADVYVEAGDEITLAGMTCQVITTPGHTAGGCCYYFKEGGFAFIGRYAVCGICGENGFPDGQHERAGAFHQGKTVFAPG